MSKKLLSLAMAAAFVLSVASLSHAAEKKSKEVAKIEKSEGAAAEGANVEKHHKGKKKKKSSTQEAAPATK